LKKEGYIAIVIAVIIAVAMYFIPRSPEPSTMEDGHEHTTEQPDSLEVMVAQAVEMLNTGTAPPMQAIGLLRKVLDIEPKHINANFYLGYFSIMSGQFDKAEERLSVVIERLPDNADAYFLMAQAKKGLGDIPSAKEYLSKCLENNPIEETKQQATALLNEIDSI